MKKLLPFLMVLLLATACNKDKTMTEDLMGQWSVYKYLRNNVDKTNEFMAMHPNYTITFAGSGFVENANDTFQIITGTWEFTSNNEKILLLDTVYGEREYTLFNLTGSHVQFRNDTSQLYMSKDTI